MDSCHKVLYVTQPLRRIVIVTYFFKSHIVFSGDSRIFPLQVAKMRTVMFKTQDEKKTLTIVLFKIRRSRCMNKKNKI